MNFRQKRGDYKTTFDFGPDKLDFTFASAGGRQGGAVAYEQIPPGWKYAARKRWRSKYIAAALALIGVVCAVGLYDEQRRTAHALQGALTLLAAATAIAIAYYGADRALHPPTGLTVVPGKHEIRVIHDGQRETIEGEIRRRRRAAMRGKLAKVDPLNLPGAELGKFRWLYEEEIISEAEYTQAIAQLSEARPDDSAAPGPEQKKLH